MGITLVEAPRMRSSKIEEISADLRLQDTWYFLEANAAAGQLTCNSDFKHKSKTFIQSIKFPKKYLLHNNSVTAQTDSVFM